MHALANVYRKNDGEMIGVDIGSTSIKVVKLAQVGQNVRIDNYAIVPLRIGAISEGSIDTEEVTNKLKQAFKLLGVKPKTQAAFSLPPISNVATKDVNFSKDLTDFEIEQQIFNNTQKYSPFQREQGYFDFSLSPAEDGSGGQTAHILATSNESVDSRASLIQAAGIIPKVATTDHYAMEKAIPFILGNKDTFHKPVAIFDIGSNLTTFFFIKDGVIKESDPAEFGGHALVDAIVAKYNCSTDDAEDIAQNDGDDREDYREEVLIPFMEGVFGVIEQKIRMSDEDHSSGYSEIFISGGTANTDSLIDYLNDKLDTRVSKLNPFASIIINPNLNEQKVKKDGPILTTAFGLALYSFIPGLNLMPWRDDLIREKKRSYMMGAILAGVLGCGLTFGFWSFYNNDLNNNIAANAIIEARSAETDARLEQLKDIDLKREQMIKRMGLIQGLQSQRPVVVSILNSVVDQMPNEAFLTSLSKDEGTFTFTGKASDATVVAEFMRSLKKTGWFNNIFMSSYIAYTENPHATQKPSSVTRAEDKYGSFIVTADLLKKQDEKALNQDVVVLRETSTADPTKSGEFQRGESNPTEASASNPVPAAGGTAPVVMPADAQQNSQALVSGGDHAQN